jgi:putative membrane protein
MESRRARTFQALILALLGFFLLEKIWSGRILLYINQRFVLLILAAAVALIIMAQMVLTSRTDTGEAHDHGDGQDGKVSRANLAWLALPLILGFLVPARSLGTSGLANRGIQTGSLFSVQSSSGAVALDRPANQRTVLDWIRAFHAQSSPTGRNGEPVDVIGFVYHDPRLKSDQFLVGRYTVACCIADATAIGMTVHWTDAQSLQNNQWVRVQGTMTAGELDGAPVPAIIADQVTAIPEPDQPYLFP